MRLNHGVLVATLSGIALVASAGMALADPAVATANVNVRSGPGSTYGVVDVLRAGERVDIEGCQAGWCYVDGHGSDGWVSGQYLADVSAPTRPSGHFGTNFGHFPGGGFPRPGNPPPPPKYPDHNGGFGGNNGGPNWNGNGPGGNNGGPNWNGNGPGGNHSGNNGGPNWNGNGPGGNHSGNNGGPNWNGNGPGSNHSGNNGGSNWNNNGPGGNHSGNDHDDHDGKPGGNDHDHDNDHGKPGDNHGKPPAKPPVTKPPAKPPVVSKPPAKPVPPKKDDDCKHTGMIAKVFCN